MRSCLAMVGFGEGLWAAMIAELYIATYFVALLAFAAFAYRSRIMAVVSLLVDFAVAFLFQPWEAFAAASNGDPDWESLLQSWRIAASVWLFVSAAATACAIWYCWPSRSSPPIEQLSNPGPPPADVAANPDLRIMAKDGAKVPSGHAIPARGQDDPGFTL